MCQESQSKIFLMGVLLVFIWALNVWDNYKNRNNPIHESVETIMRSMRGGGKPFPDWVLFVAGIGCIIWSVSMSCEQVLR